MVDYMNWNIFETKKFSGMVNSNTGEIIAYEKSPLLSRKKLKTNVDAKINNFPYTDEDYVILAAKKAI